MDGGAWWPKVYGVAQSDMAKQLTHTHTHSPNDQFHLYDFSFPHSKCYFPIFFYEFKATMITISH